jgi:diguanylate cyclase (GGDEF)-like protein
MTISTKEEFIANAQQLTSQSSTKLEFWINDQISMAKLIANDHRIISLCLNPQDSQHIKDATHYLEEINNAYPYYENLPIAIKQSQSYTTNIKSKSIEISDGSFIVDTVNQATIGKGGTSYSYINEVFKGKSYYISEIYPSIWRRNPIFVISAPVLNKEEIIGVSIVSPQIDYFTKLFVDPIKLGDTGYMFIIDSSGSVIAHSDRSAILSRDPDVKNNANFVINKIEEETPFFKANLVGKDKYYYGQKVNLSEDNSQRSIYIVVAQETKEIYKNIYKMIFYSSLILIMTSIFLVKTYSLIHKTHLHSKVEKQLLELNQQLEFQVKERTFELEEMAHRDSLTGLFNHRYLIASLDEIMFDKENIGHLTIALMDIDNFKQINDQFGHPFGDEVLKKIATTLQVHAGDSSVVGRYGGEEFLIIFKTHNFDTCHRTIEALRKEIEALTFTDTSLKVTASFGLSSWQGEAMPLFINKADQLMYAAKNNGKNQVMI